MHDLIKIEASSIGGEAVQTVNARELHEGLESKKDFSSWVKQRLDILGARENKDFIIFTQKGENKGRPKNEYFLTIDIAKHFAMMERTEKGHEIREYFIQCEKELRTVISPKQNFLLNIMSAEDDLSRAVAINKYELGYVKPLEQFKEQALPKVSYYDNVLNSSDLVTTTQIAKDYGMTAIELNKLLESLGMQYKQSGQWLLYHNYAKAGYTQSSTCVTELGTVKLNTKWTQKGRLFIYEMLKERGVLPVCEQGDSICKT